MPFSSRRLGLQFLLPCPADRKDAGPCFLHADVRGDGLANECVEQLPLHIVHPGFFFPQDCYFGVFGGRVDGHLLFGAVMPYAEAHNGTVKR